jgi:hypothetical protein
MGKRRNQERQRRICLRKYRAERDQLKAQLEGFTVRDEVEAFAGDLLRIMRKERDAAQARCAELEGIAAELHGACYGWQSRAEAAEAREAKLRAAIKEEIDGLADGFVSCNECGAEIDTGDMDTVSALREALAQPAQVEVGETGNSLPDKAGRTRLARACDDDATDACKKGASQAFPALGGPKTEAASAEVGGESRAPASPQSSPALPGERPGSRFGSKSSHQTAGENLAAGDQDEAWERVKRGLDDERRRAGERLLFGDGAQPAPRAGACECGHPDCGKDGTGDFLDGAGRGEAGR